MVYFQNNTTFTDIFGFTGILKVKKVLLIKNAIKNLALYKPGQDAIITSNLH